MTLPVLSIIAFIFIIWINYEIHKSSNLSKKDTDDFWSQEKNANSNRRVDISELNYITISTEQLPMSENSDQTINSYRNTIAKLSGKKMINLSRLTNTELKSKYGTANITLLSEYDSNYIALVSILQKWAERLYSQENFTDCKSVLEYSVFCITDVKKAYILLAELYMQQNTPEKIVDLINAIPKTNIYDKDCLIKVLISIQNS